MTGRRVDVGGAWIDWSRPIGFTFDGRELTGFEGDTLASALLANGVDVITVPNMLRLTFCTSPAQLALRTPMWAKPFMPPPPVPHRGEHEPELMQLLMQLREHRQGQAADEDEEQSAAEMLQQLMEQEQEDEPAEATEEAEGVDYNSPISRYLRALSEREPTPDRPSPIIESEPFERP